MMKKLLSALLFSLAFTFGVQAQIVNTLPYTLQNNTTADATQVMADLQQIVNNVNANAAKNGTNSDILALNALSTPITPTQGGTNVYIGGTSTGTANAQVVATPSPSGFTLSTGKRIVFLAGSSNTGAATFNIAGTGATNVYKLTPSGSAALTGGEIRANTFVEAIFDGTQFQLITNNLSVLGPLTSLASATTTDLGTISSHNVNITGTTAITGFGSTASTDFPIYYLKFAAATPLTYNATSFILPCAASFTAAAGDTAAALYLGSGNWQIVYYQRAAAGALTPCITLDTDSTLAGNSDARVASQKATKTYVDANSGGTNGIVVARGTFYWDGAAIQTNGLSNVSSITRAGTGDYTINFTASLTDINYQFVGVSAGGARLIAPFSATKNTGSLRIISIAILTAGLQDVSSSTRADFVVIR